ncbi:phage portal protein [Bradyrhizobium sp. USDA 313]|uniref:phage portal protein n=1 Tax=Bradyrhizobium sp. USDA 313 TaxID=3156307 RepID=UPI0035197AB6
MGAFRDMLAEGLLGKMGLVRPTNQFDPFSSAAGSTSGGFDGGRYRRRLASWKPTQYSVNTIMAAQGPLLRSRCRDLMRNSAHAVAARENFVANLIGAGIKPSSLITDDPELRKQVMEVWMDWTEEADADGMTDFYGMQSIIASALFEAGEIFVRLRARRIEDGLTVPLQIELLESEMCPYWLNQIAPNGNYIMNGVEFDFRAKRVAYWFFPGHPGDAPVDPQVYLNMDPVRVPADQVLHIFRPTRPGQVRGVPLVSPAMTRLFFLDQYDDAELERKRIAALFAGFVTSPAPEDILPAPAMSDAEQPMEAGVGLAGLEPGTMQALLPGEDVKFSEPADVGGTYEAFQYRQQLAAFSAMGVPYMIGTGDTRRASYSSLRGVIVEYRRKLEQLQYNIIVHQYCRPIWRRWFNDAVLTAAIPVTTQEYVGNEKIMTRAKWIAPRFEWVDPLKDRQAEKLAVDAGFKSRSDVIEAEGYDPEETDRRIAADKERAEELGLEFPVLQAAASQPSDPNADPQEQADANQDLSGDGDDQQAA